MKKFLQYIVYGVVFLFVVGIALKVTQDTVKDTAAVQMQDIQNQVADDAVKQYEIAKKNGNKTDAYVAAGMVCAAYLQAKDEANYAKWKAIEKEEAKLVGLPE